MPPTTERKKCYFGRQHSWGLCFEWSDTGQRLGLTAPAFVCGVCDTVSLDADSLAEAAEWAGRKP